MVVSPLASLRGGLMPAALGFLVAEPGAELRKSDLFGFFLLGGSGVRPAFDPVSYLGGLEHGLPLIIL